MGKKVIRGGAREGQEGQKERGEKAGGEVYLISYITGIPQYKLRKSKVSE